MVVALQACLAQGEPLGRGRAVARRRRDNATVSTH